MDKTLHIIGGGMAGSEAAWQAANMGVKVVIHEMRPKVETFAHRTGYLGEMVCSNSFRSDDHEQNAVGLLHWEMRAAGGLIITQAYEHRLPAGGLGRGSGCFCRLGHRQTKGASPDRYQR